jgi:ABC-type polysaccharide/polyol phosphate export permease
MLSSRFETMRPIDEVAHGRIGDRLSRLIAYRTLVKYLVLKDIKVKSRGTYLGMAWTLMNPLITIVTYFIVFQHIFRIGVPNFLAFFLVGLLMWLFFARSITAAATCLLDNDAMVKKAAFPLEILPVSGVLYHLFNHVVAFGLAVPLMLLFWGGRLSWHLLWTVVILVAFVAFSLALSLLLSTVGVFFRDTRDILEVALPVLFWGTPIFYDLRMAPAFLRPALMANPLSPFIDATRAAILEAQGPSWTALGLMGFWIGVTAVSGAWVFTRFAPRFAEEN